MTNEENKIIQKGIIHSAHEENIAINNYTRRMDYAQSKGDIKTAKLYFHIIKQEKEHLREFKNRRIES